jgi:CheY-like chemotaxis protein
MVYGMARRHGAEIEIDSVLGRGTTFRLTYATSPAAVVQLSADRTEPVALHHRILVIDDDPLVLESLGTLLENEGHTIFMANDPQVGIDAFLAALKRKQPFAVVITDLGMPYVDGQQVARAVKTASPQTVVILLTGWGQVFAADGCIPMNVDRVLSKPPKLAELRAALALTASQDSIDPDKEPVVNRSSA